jgi:arginase
MPTCSTTQSCQRSIIVSLAGCPGGELTSTLRLAIQSRRAVGLEVTIYNPMLDTDGTGARELVRIIGDVLA